MARRSISALLATVLGSLLWVASSSAAPQVSLTVRPRPIAGVAQTGNLRGAGATLEIHVAITGTEYGGYPPPLTQLDLTLPPGMRWSTAGFPVCHYNRLEPQALGPSAGPCGSENHDFTTGSNVQMTVAFGKSILPETARTKPFDNTAGGISLFLYGHEPTLAELFVEGTVSPANGAQQFVFPFPVIETVPGADDASITSFALLAGSARALDNGHAFSLRMPTGCPRGSLTYALQASFGGPTPGNVKTTYRAGCPRTPRPKR